MFEKSLTEQLEILEDTKKDLKTKYIEASNALEVRIKETKKAIREIRREKERQKNLKIRKELEFDFGTDVLPADVRNEIWRKAWEEGHSNGINEVKNYYHEFAEFAFRVRKV